MVPTPQIIGRREFTDGITREVFEDTDGRQWVTGPDGEPVYGNWILTEALVELTPVVVQA